MFEFVWAWVLTHFPDAVKIASGIKVFADTADSVKKLAPPKLETKDAAQTYMTETLAIATDQQKDLEERRLELDTRSELTESMVKLTVIEATYNIARYAIFTSFTAFMLSLFARVFIIQKRTKPPAP